jgi:CRISPR system Cascade subunit CasC
MQRTFVDVHIVQTVPPSNLNRDDTGSPKSARYGGVRRARVSSQAWKRATRQAFVDYVPESALSVRTRRLVELLSGRLAETGSFDPDQAKHAAEACLAGLGLKAKSASDSSSQYLLFVGRSQIDEIVRRVVACAEELNASKDAKKRESIVTGLRLAEAVAGPQPIDVAMFGRMVADRPEVNVEAAVQVAHAISTHAVDTEFDYFTAVDDLNPVEETGAGMIGTVEFNSATLYRYATLDVEQLGENLGDVAAVPAAIGAFLRAFAKSIPSGHQTSFAHRTLPELVVVMVREDQPVNLVGAFERPVWAPPGDGLAAQSVKALAEHAQGVEAVFGAAPLLTGAAFLPSVAEPASAFGDPIPFDELVGRVTEFVAGRVEAG